MDFLEKLKTNKIMSFISRNSTALILGLVSLFLLVPTVAEFKTILFICVLVCLCIILSGVTLYAYTHYSATKKLIEGDDGEINGWERELAIRFAGAIYLANALLIGLTVLGVYIAQKGF